MQQIDSPCRVEPRPGRRWRHLLIGAAGVLASVPALAATLYLTAANLNGWTAQGLIYPFDIQPDGSLLPRSKSHVPTGGDPQHMVVLPPTPERPATAFVADPSLRSVWQYRSDGQQGLSWLGDDSTVGGSLDASTNGSIGEAGGLEIDPAGRFVYMSNLIGGEILSWRLNPQGLIASHTPRRTSAGYWPGPLAIAGDTGTGAHLYVASRDKGGSLHGYVLDPASGQPVELPGSPVSSYSPAPTALLLHRPGGAAPAPQAELHVYAATYEPPCITHLSLLSDGDFHPGHVQRDSLTPVLVPVALAVAPQGRFLYAGGLKGTVQRFDIDPVHGKLTAGPIAADVGHDVALLSLATHRTTVGVNLLFLVDGTANALRSYQIGTDGRLAPLPPTPLPEQTIPMRIVIAD